MLCQTTMPFINKFMGNKNVQQKNIINQIFRIEQIDFKKI